jgi:hypothetical protein
MNTLSKIKTLRMKPVDRVAYRVTTKGVHQIQRGKPKKARKPGDYATCFICGCSLLHKRLPFHIKRVHHMTGRDADTPPRPLHSLSDARVKITKPTQNYYGAA